MRLLRLSIAGTSALALCLAAAPAPAGNWSFGGSVSERLEARSGLGFNEDDELVFRATTRLGLGLGYQTPRTQWSASSGVSYRQSITSGDDGGGDGDGLQGVSDPRISGSVVHRSRDHEVGANVSFSRRSLDPTDSVLFEDEFGVVDFTEVEEDVTETRIGFGADWSWSATPRTTLGLGTDVAITRFSEDRLDLEPSDSISLTGSVNHLLDPRTSGGLSLSYRNYRSDGEVTDVTTDALTLLVNASRQLTPRHSLSVSVGGGAVLRETETLRPVPADDELNFNFQGGLSFDYSGLRDTALSLSLQRALQSAADGTLANTTTLAVAASRPLTPRFSLQLNGAYARRSSEDNIPGRSSDEQNQSLRLATGLSAELAPRWTGSAGVDLRFVDDEDEDALSAGVFLQINRDLVLNP